MINKTSPNIYDYIINKSDTYLIACILNTLYWNILIKYFGKREMLIFEKDPYKIIFKEILRFINIKFIKIKKK